MAKAEKEVADQADASVGGAGILKTVINWSVAAISLAVIGSFASWALNLGLRDPHDVPIVRAMEGPSRVAPVVPGGKQASHQGLAVNSVLSDGGVANPSDTVVLAPEPANLTEDDQPLNNGFQAQKTATYSEENLDASKLADQSLGGLAQESITNIDPDVIPRGNIRGTEHSPEASLRPKSRPTSLSVVKHAVQHSSPIRPARASGVQLNSVPLGTRLIQLGAYDNAELAKSEWIKLLIKHSHLLDDKKRLVVSAQSGGRKFYRLRAAGFNNLDESRALCSALLAVGTPCIPVTAR